MKKFILLTLLLLIVGGISVGTYFFSDQVAGLREELSGDDPDMPSQFQTGMSKEEFMAKRAEYIAELRGVEEGKLFDPTLRIRAVKKLEKQEVARAQMPESPEKESITAAWTEIGPRPIPNGQVVAGTQLPVSGRTIGIAVHPTNPNIVYAGTAQGGLYRSTDGGTTWIPMLDNALSLAVNTVAISPSQPDTIFVGTGEAGFSADSFFGVGIYRIDSASTSTPVVTGPIGGADFTGRSIGKIVVHPTDPNIIFASSTAGGGGGISGSANNVLAARGLFRSTNALSANPTFTKMTITGLAAQDRNILDIVMDPGNPNLVLCTEVDSFNSGEGGVYRSTDALAPTPTFVRTFATNGVGTVNSRTELALNRTGSVITVYAASASDGGTVHQSTDGGATFALRIDNNFCGGQCFYDIAVDVDPVDANRVYIGGTGTTATFAFSTNGGTTFTNSQNGLHTDSHAIAVAPSLPSTIYFGSDGGIYKSTDSGGTWASLNNTTFRATQFMGLAVHPTDPNFTIGGTQDNGTNYYDPSGVWRRSDFGDGGYAVIDQNATDTTNVRMYHTYFNNETVQGYGTATLSSVGEGGWAFRGCNGSAGNGIPCNGAVLFYAPLEQGPGSPNTIYYGANILYRSANNGTNHTAVSQSFGTDPISAIGISPTNDNVRIIGTRAGQLFGTTTGSATLTNLDTGNAVPNAYIARAVIDPNNVNKAYVTLSVFGMPSVYKTTNLNSATPTWTASAGSLPQIPVSSFLVDPLNSNRLYAGTDIGVYTSDDGGASWTPFGTGLPRVAVFGMKITPGRMLRIATHGRGMWEIAAIAPSYEGDVITRPMGDGAIDSDDIQQIRIFSVGIGLPYQSNEFQRADCSPRSTGGDGAIDGDDIQQARRYSVSIDPYQLAGGPASIAPPAEDDWLNQALELPFGKQTVGTKGGVQAEPAAFRILHQNTSAGATLVVPILVNTVGNEAGYTFSIAFDSTKLTNPSVMIGGDGNVIFNANNPGQIGFSVTSFNGNPDGTLAAGSNVTLVKVTFTVEGEAAGDVPITFTDTPSRRKASGVDPNSPLPQPGYTGGTITIGGATAAGASLSGKVLNASGRGIANAQVIITNSTGEVVKTERTNGFGYYSAADIAAGESYIVRVQSKQYKFATRVVIVAQDIDGIDFTAHLR